MSTETAGDGSCGAGLRCCSAGGARTSLSVKKYSRKKLVELAIAAVVWECVGARLVEIKRV